MKKNVNGLSIVSMACSLLIAGCGSIQGAYDVKETHSNISAKADQIMAQAAPRLKPEPASRESKQEVNAPWLAGKSVPVAREVNLPTVLRRNIKVSMLEAACTGSLTSMAVCLTRDLGIPFRVMPEALIPLSQFAQRRSSGAAATPTPANVPGGGAQSQNLVIPLTEMPLSQFLELVASHYGVNYRVTDTGSVEIFRIETRVLRLRALAQKITNSVTVNTGFESQSKTTFTNTADDAIKNMKEAMLSLGTNAGDLIINPETKAVIVTDTPAAIARIEAYIDVENKRLTRRITVVMEELVVTNKTGNEVSVDWNVVFKAAGVSSGTQTSPSSLASSTASALALGVGGLGKFAGTALAVKALNEMGLTTVVRSMPLSTLNGSAASIGMPTIFDYVSQITSNSISNTSGTVSSPSIQQKEEKVGAFFSVTPEAQDDGTILLSYTLQDRAGNLTPYTVSVGGVATTIQQRNIQEISLAQRTVVRAGITHLVGGLDENTQSSTSRRLDVNAPIALGGSNSIHQNARRVLLLVTAVAEEGV